MTDYTAREVEAAVEATFDEDAYDDEDQGSWHSLGGYCGTGRLTVTLRGEDVEITKVADKPSNDNDGYGAGIWVVVRAGDQLFKKKGYTSSCDGDQWDGALTLVVEAEKTVTVYKAA